MVGNLDLAPGAVRVEEDEEVDRAVAPILAVVAFELAWRGRDRLARLADQLGRALVEAHHRPPRIRGFGIEVEDILHAGDILAIDLGNAPHVLAPRLQLVLGQDNLAGWWEAVIVRIDDGEFLVRWRDDPKEPRVSRGQEYIAFFIRSVT